MENLKAITMLLVEDDPGDQKLIKTSLRQQKLSNEVRIVECGEEALDYLHRSLAGQVDCPWPDLILLDLNMPGMGGKAFLRTVKAAENFKGIPVVILTTSDAEEDILNSYELHAAGYVKKPVALSSFQTVMKDIEEYWFVLCKTASSRRVPCPSNP